MEGNVASYLPAESWCGGFSLRKETMKTTRRAGKGPSVCKQSEAVAEKIPANRDGFSPRAKFGYKNGGAKGSLALKKACAEAGRETVAGAGKIVL